MNLYRCIICGDPCLSLSQPSNCPYCGAPGEYLVPAKDWQQPPLIRLTDISRENLRKAFQLEEKNIRFYRCAAEAAEDEEVKAMFTALAKIETEHASTIGKMLNLPKLSVKANSTSCFPSTDENIREAHEREKKATRFYAQAAKEAIEPRVKQVFTALVKIESDHFSLLGRRR